MILLYIEIIIKSHENLILENNCGCVITNCSHFLELSYGNIKMNSLMNDRQNQTDLYKRVLCDLLENKPLCI